MALARARRNDTGFNYWPGFVDALSTLVLSIVFLLSVFLVVQFFLSQEVTGKDKALEQLNAKIAQLNELLSLEKLGKLTLDDQVSQLKAGLASAETERDRLAADLEGAAAAKAHLDETLKTVLETARSREQDATQIRMAVEDDAKHVERLTLVPVRCPPNTGDTRNMRVFLVQHDLQTNAMKFSG